MSYPQQSKAIAHSRSAACLVWAVAEAVARALARSLARALAYSVMCVVALAVTAPHAQEKEPSAAHPPTEVGGPVLPAGTVLLRKAGKLGEVGVLRLGVAASGYPPLEVMTTDGLVAGITADYAALVGKRLRKRVEVVIAPDFNEVLDLLKRGEIDLVGSVAPTAGREAYATFTAPYLSSQPVVIQRREAQARIDAQLGTVIAVDTGSAVVEFIKRDFPTAKLVELPSPLAALQLVARGQADSYVGEITTAAYLMETRYLSSLRIRSAAGFATGELGFAVPKSKPELARSIDAALATISQEERDSVRRRWLPFATLATSQSTRIDLSPQEQAWLKAHPEIRLGVEGTYPPFSMVNANGKFEGLAADYLKIVSDRTGLNVKLVPGLSWTQILEGIGRRTLDITPAVVDTPERRPYMLFAGPIVALPSVFVTSVNSTRHIDGFGSLSGMRMALIKNGPVTLRVESDFPGITPVYVTSGAEALAKVAAGEADVFMSNINFITQEIDSRYLGTLKIAGTVADSPTELNIGVRSDWPQLQSIVRKGLDTISRSEHEAIRQKWLSVKINQGFAWHEVLKVAGPLLLGLLAVIGITLFSNRRLHKQFVKTKEAEAQVAYQLALQSILLDAAPIPVFVVDPQARYTDCNRAYESLFGVKREDIRGKTLPQLSDASSTDILKLHSDLTAVLHSGKSGMVQYRVSMADGRNLEFTSAGRVFALPDGTPGGLVGTVVDMSQEHARQRELADARDRAESATKAKSAFLATMSHEIRTPMNGVLGMLELLSHSSLNREQRNSITVAQESGRALLTLLSDVLDLSKIEANKMTIETAPASLRLLAESVMQTLAAGARAKGLKLHLFIAPDVAATHACDVLRLRQILFNLLGNAIKFTAKGHASLRISVMGEAAAAPLIQGPLPAAVQRIVIEVIDTGIGIPANAQAQLFAPFEQAERSISRQFGGTGLGLAICRRLADLMGASLTLQSEPGVGTTLRLEAEFVAADPAPVGLVGPVARVDVPATVMPVAIPIPLPVTVPKVMLLADDKTDEATLAVYLSAGHFEPLVPSLGFASLAQLQQFVRVQRPHAAVVSPALLARLALPGKTLETLMLQASSHALSPAVVVLSETPQSAPHLVNQPLLPSAVAALLAVWRGVPSGLPTGLPDGRSNLPQLALPLPGAGAPRILVAEDHPTNQTIVCRQLEMIGCAVTLCPDGAAALATWREALLHSDRRFSALLVDCHMPVMDGYALASHVRAAEADLASRAPGAEPQPRVPVIALTADAGGSVRLQCVAAGMDDLLVKPVDIPTLHATLAKWLPKAAFTTQPSVSLPSAPDRDNVAFFSPSVDVAHLIQEMGGRDAAAAVMADYLRTTEQDLADLRAISHDLTQVWRIAHRIKGAARVVGAQHINDLAAELEAQAKAGLVAPEKFTGCVNQLSRALAQVRVDAQALEAAAVNDV